MKGYTCVFGNRDRPTKAGFYLVKYGITHHDDVMKRFDPKVDDRYVKNYSDWKIRPMWSFKFGSKQQALEFEHYCLDNLFPYNSKYKVWVEKELGFEDNKKYATCSRISELRLIPIKLYGQLVDALFEYKREYYDPKSATPPPLPEYLEARSWSRKTKEYNY